MKFTLRLTSIIALHQSRSLLSLKDENGLEVDHDGDFCYGRHILRSTIISRPGIPPRQPAGVRIVSTYL
jgi:hypothetical protein